MLLSNSVLCGRYRIQRILGQGGMGAVYLATEELLGGKKVAIKEMAVRIDDQQQRQRAIQQFQQEAQILASLDHPGLVDVTHYFEEDDKQYLVMAFVDGKTLEALLNECPGMLPIPQVLDWADQISAVLEYLHNQSPPVIFRDLKPSNVMVDSHQRVRLIDFGIARSFDPDVRTATFIKGAGTPGFAPVEQYGGGASTDARTDVYALGATLYTLLTRTLPPASIDLMLNEVRLERPSTFNPAVTPALELVLLTLMAIRKEDRYQSVAIARQALKTAATGVTTLRYCSDCGKPLNPATGLCPQCQPAPLPVPSLDTTPTSLKSESTAVKAGLPPSNLQPPIALGTGGLPTEMPTSATAKPLPETHVNTLVHVPPARSGVAIGVAIGAIVVGVLVAVANHWLAPPPPAVVQAPPTPRVVAVVAPPTTPAGPSLQIDTVPTGAQVVLDSQARGTTPLSLAALPAGKHALQLAVQNFRPVSGDVMVQGSTVSVQIPGQYQATCRDNHLTASLAAQGLDVTLPPGGRLTVDGVAVPAGEHTLYWSGSHQLAVECQGYSRWSKTVDLDHEKSPLVVKMQQLPAQVDIVTTPAGAMIEVDGKPLGQTPLHHKPLAAGPHKFEVRHSGYESAHHNVDLQPGGKAHYTWTLTQQAAAAPAPAPQTYYRPAVVHNATRPNRPVPHTSEPEIETIPIH